ncbi:MAG: peptidoglycan DD-metalloendopeptidase family protein [Candidatus Hatepunaea meridiana]|nr:peptidoglycan DD-metalloendopeptidase family protein [Candidatus Hatepunaea meridiana]
MTTAVKIYLFIILFPIINNGFCWGTSESNDKTELLQQEIKILEQRIGQTEAGKQGIIRQLQDNDRKIELRRRLIREFEQQSIKSSRRLKHIRSRVSDLEIQIDVLSDNLAVEESGLWELRNQVGERIAYMYKRLRSDKIALLLGSANLNDLSQRQRYLQAIARFDQLKLIELKLKRNQVFDERQKIIDVNRQLAVEKKTRQNELTKVNKLIKTKRSEENELKVEKIKKQKLLDRIVGDSELLHSLLDERQQSLQQIEWEIQRLEGRRPAARETWQPDVPFKQLSGKLPWPLERRTVVQPFGQVRHPELGTTTMNPGIDLKASIGDPVYSVARGQVTRIAWLRGFGNTVILSHGDGYYTVYARLGKIFLAEGDVLEPGQPIGEVGDSGAESSFHFEVWSKRNKQNPLKWLL